MSKHEPNPAAGITPEIAAEMDKAMAAMESGDPDGNVLWDPTSETEENLHPAEIGTSSHAAHRGVSSNSDMLFSALVQREKNADPEAEFDVARERAVDKFNAMLEESGEEDE